MACRKLETVAIEIFLPTMDGDIAIEFMLNFSSCVLWSLKSLS
jgi:hypothetical protein